MFVLHYVFSPPPKLCLIINILHIGESIFFLLLFPQIYMLHRL